MTTIRELITKLGFDIDTKSIDVFNKSITNMKHSIVAVGGIASGFAATLFGLVKNVSNVGDEIAKSSQELGLSTDALQEWRFAASQAGISQDELASSLKIFKQRLGDAATTGTGPFVDRMNRLGISLVDGIGKLKSTDDLLLEVSESLEKTGDSAAIAVAGVDLFGRGGLRTANALSKGALAMIEMRLRAHELGIVLDKETITATEKFNDEFHETLSVVASVKNMVGAGLMPAVRDVMKRFVQWVLVNRQLITQNLEKVMSRIGIALGFMWNILVKVNQAFEWFAKQVGGVENAIYLLLGAFTAFQLSPLIVGLYSLARAIMTVSAAAVIAQIRFLFIPAAIVLGVAAIALLIGEILEFFGYVKKGSKESITLIDALIAGFTALGVGLAFIAAFKFGQLVGALAYLGGAALEAMLSFLALNAAILFWPAVIAVFLYGAYQLVQILFSLAGYNSDLISNIENSWKDFSSWFTKFWDDIGNIASTISWDEFTDGLKGWANLITDWVEKKFHEMIDSIVAKFQYFVDKIKSLNPFADDKNKPVLNNNDGLLPLPTDYKKPTVNNKTLLPMPDDSNVAMLDAREARVNQEKKQMLYNFAQGVTNEANAMKAAPMQIPQQLLSTNNSITNQSTTKPVNITSNVNVTLPAGTSGIDSNQVTEAVKFAWQEELQRVIESGLFNNTELE